MGKRKGVPAEASGNEAPAKRGRGKRKGAADVTTRGTEVVSSRVEEVDQQLVEQAVKEIRRQYEHAVHSAIEKGNQGMLDIGRYVLVTFYEGDPEKASARGRKPASLRALADHRDMPIGKTWLNNVVRAAAQEARLLNAGVKEIKELPATHQIELLRAPEDQKKDLIRKAVKQELTVRQLQDQIDSLSTRALPAAGTDTDADGDSGRSPIPRPLLSFIGLNFDRLANPNRLGNLAKGQRTKYRKALEEAQDRIKQLLKAIDAVGA